mmetsp:Transcript_10673/g.26781  ORF Transcript_10673/g.26781 Transcript_10673/m.26781 type:complete len:270 (+) Transcript_10673:1955-2764(+)
MGHVIVSLCTLQKEGWCATSRRCRSGRFPRLFGAQVLDDLRGVDHVGAAPLLELGGRRHALPQHAVAHVPAPHNARHARARVYSHPKGGGLRPCWDLHSHGMPDHCLGEPQHVFGVLRGGSEYVFSAVVGLGQPFHLHAGNCPFVCLFRRRGLSFAAGVHLLKGPRHVRVPLLHAGIHHRCRQHLTSDQPDRGHIAVPYCLQLVHIVQIQHVIQRLKQIIQELHHQGRIHVLGEAREADDVREHDADAIVPAGQVLVPTRDAGPSYRSF